MLSLALGYGNLPQFICDNAMASTETLDRSMTGARDAPVSRPRILRPSILVCAETVSATVGGFTIVSKQQVSELGDSSGQYYIC